MAVENISLKLILTNYFIISLNHVMNIGMSYIYMKMPIYNVDVERLLMPDIHYG